MAKNLKGKMFIGGIMLFLIIVSLLLTFNLESKRPKVPLYPVELKSVQQEQMGLKVFFKGHPRSMVYAFLFIKKEQEERFAGFFTDSAQFSEKGEAELRFQWDAVKGEARRLGG